jgi:hypothetical protein
MTRAKMLKGFFILLFLVALSDVSAQEFLYLKKKHTAKTTKIVLYDIIQIKEKSGELTKGMVLSVTPTSILLEGAEIDFDQIEFIRTNHMFWKGLGRSLEYGGLFFAGIFVANGLISGASPVITNGALIVVSSAVVLGIVMEVLSIKTYRMEKGWMLEPIIIPRE